MKNNDMLYHLPLIMLHENFPYRENDSYENKCRIITKTLMNIRDMGFGGVVINYVWSRPYVKVPGVKECQEEFYMKGYEYLRGETGWNLFNFVCEECVRLGMRFWLYDEKGYPSGTAGGQIVAQNPDFEARAMVIVEKTLEPFEECDIELPIGHECFLSAFVYKSAGGYKEISDFTPVYRADCYKNTDRVHLVNTSNEKAVACAFVKKHMFELAHAQNNICSIRRYIDFGDEDAVKAFIDSTYEKYYEKAGKFFNESLDDPKLCEFEAMFTDEPSYMGCYLNKGAVASVVCDIANKDMVMYPVVNFSNKLVETFEKLNGYSCLDGMIYCFAGENAEGKKYRLDYYRTLSYMAENAYFKQIGDWCEEHKINFAGHALMEDELLYHPTFEGNYFSLFRHMRYPGLDILFCRANEVYDEYSLAAKIISSVAKAYDKKHVLEEISRYFDAVRDITVDSDDYYSLMALQYAMGADIITSYYGYQNPDYQKFNLAFGRLGTKTQGKNLCDVILYYAIETVQMHHKGSDTYDGIMDVHGEYNAQEVACSRSTTKLQKALADAQVCYDFADLEFLSKCRIENGVLVTPNNDKYRALVLPCMECLPELEELLKTFKANGLEIKYVSNPAFEDVKHTNCYNSEEELVASFDRSRFYAPVSAKNGGRLFMAVRDTDSGKAFMFVNADREDKEIEIGISGIKAPVLYDPLNDSYVDLTVGNIDGVSKIKFNVKSLETVVVIEK